MWDVLQRRRGRRLRRADQPDDRRGPDHGRPHRGLRDGQHAVHHLRRRGQLRRLELHGLPAADRLGDARASSCTRSSRPCPHHPIGAKGVGECATVGGPAAFVNAVMDAIKDTGVRNIDMPLLPDRVLRGAHPAPRRLRRAAGEDGRLMRRRSRMATRAGTSSSRPRELAAPRRGVRARHRRLAAGPVVRPAGLARASSPPTGELLRLDRRRLRRAGRHPRGAAGDRATASRGCCCSARPSSSARRAGRDDGHPDLLPERGRPAGLHRAGRARRPHLVVVGRSPMAHTLADLAAALGWRADVVDGADFSAADVDARSIVVVATQGHGDEEAIEQAVAGRARRTSAWSPRASAARRCSATSPTAACRSDLLDRVRVPVGLDLGHTSHREIAVADPGRARAAPGRRRARARPAPAGRRRRRRRRRSTRCAG